MTPKAKKWMTLGLMLALAAGCTRIQEPWIPNPDQLKVERSRPPELQQSLRVRLAEMQRDR